MHDPADIQVRQEGPDDRGAIREVIEAAFGSSIEADLVDSLRGDGLVLLSLVADLHGRIVGHVLFSRMWIDTSDGTEEAVALAPMAVLPLFQRRGVGTTLIHDGLGWLRESGERIAIVVGHAEYYPRFGFSSTLARQLESPFPPDVFMALELQPSALQAVRGRVRYPRAFGL